jgi:hypothetical protein
MRFQGAVIREQGQTFAVVVVQRHVVDNRSTAIDAISGFQPVFPGVPVVLVAQDELGRPTYYGRQDISRFLANVPVRAIPWREPTHIVFAPHHGRYSGKIPNSWLEKLNPKIIVIGEAPSRHLHYYTGYKILTQNKAGDLTFDCSDDGRIHIYASEATYDVDYLDWESQSKYYYYIGTLNF